MRLTLFFAPFVQVPSVLTLNKRIVMRLFPRQFGFVIALFYLCSPESRANNADNWELASHIGSNGLVAAALALPAYHRDWQGAKQAGLSVLATTTIVISSKNMIDATRPDKSENDSFPSNHAANAFAAATTLNIRYGYQVGLPAYGIATLVGVGRIKADRHYLQDVVAGAIIGSASAWFFTERFDSNVQVLPWVTSRELGVTLALRW